MICLLPSRESRSQDAKCMQGITQLNQDQRERFYTAFSVPEKEAAEYEESQHPEQKAGQPSRKRRRVVDVTSEVDGSPRAMKALIVLSCSRDL